MVLIAYCYHPYSTVGLLMIVLTQKQYFEQLCICILEANYRLHEQLCIVKMHMYIGGKLQTT